MKQIFQLSMVALLLSYTVNFASGQTPKTGSKSSTPEDVSATIIYDLSKKDYADYSNLIISKDELTKITNSCTALDKEKLLTEVDATSKKILSDTKKNFDKTIADIEAEGIVMEKIIYISCKYEIINKNGNDHLDLEIKFDFKGNEYTLFCKALFKPNSDWKVTGNLSFKNEDKLTVSKVSKTKNDTEKDMVEDAPSKVSFYTDKGTTLLTEGNGTTLHESKDLMVKISYTKAFLKYDKVIVYYKRYITKQDKKVEVGNENYLVEYKKGDFKSNQDISLSIMKPGKGEASSANCNSTVEGRGDFMFWWEQGQYCWFYVTPKDVLNKRQDLFQGISVVGYKKTGAETKEYYDNNGKLVKETYPVYDDGTTITESTDFVIKANK